VLLNNAKVGKLVQLLGAEALRFAAPAISLAFTPEPMKTLKIGEPELAGECWILDLQREWVKARYTFAGGPIWLERPEGMARECEGLLKGGMSGGAILNARGEVIAVVNLSMTGGDPQSALCRCLPGWLVGRCRYRKALRAKHEAEMAPFLARIKASGAQLFSITEEAE
jgi:hypothetical protein